MEKEKTTIKDLKPEIQQALRRDTLYDLISTTWPESLWVILNEHTDKPIFYHNATNGYWKVTLKNGSTYGAMHQTSHLLRDEEENVYIFSAVYTKWDLKLKRDSIFSKKKPKFEKTEIKKTTLIIPKKHIRMVEFESRWIIPETPLTPI